jgi:hypothetical protein
LFTLFKIRLLNSTADSLTSRTNQNSDQFSITESALAFSMSFREACRLLTNALSENYFCSTFKRISDTNTDVCY